MAGGNFNISPNVEHIGDFKDIEVALVKVITDLSSTLSEINGVADMVASNASQLQMVHRQLLRVQRIRQVQYRNYRVQLLM